MVCGKDIGMEEKKSSDGQLSFIDRLSNIEAMAQRILGRSLDDKKDIEIPPEQTSIPPVLPLAEEEEAIPDTQEDKSLEIGLKLLSKDPKRRDELRKQARKDALAAKTIQKSRPHLDPIKHPNKDFFIADLFDATLKDDMATMEHPIFALKAGDKKIRRYEHNGLTVEVQPGYNGLATIHDKDVWIFCISQLMQAINNGETDISPVIRFTAHDFLVKTNRGTSGASYIRLKNSLNRLSATQLMTTIDIEGHRESSGFGLLSEWRIIEKSKTNNKMIALEVVLPNWLYTSINKKKVLTLSPDYFRLRKPIDRRIYEIARKHCGQQAKWSVTLALLLKKTGSTTTLRKFRSAVINLVNSQELPDYKMYFESDDDTITFYSKNRGGAIAFGKAHL